MAPLTLVPSHPPPLPPSPFSAGVKAGADKEASALREQLKQLSEDLGVQTKCVGDLRLVNDLLQVPAEPFSLCGPSLCGPSPSPRYM